MQFGGIPSGSGTCQAVAEQISSPKSLLEKACKIFKGWVGLKALLRGGTKIKYLLLSVILTGWASKCDAQELTDLSLSQATNLQFQAQVSGIFSLQGGTNLSTNGWVDLAPCLLSATGNVVVIEPLIASENYKFYRFIEQPLDLAPPILVETFPHNGAILGSVNRLSVAFDECMSPTSAAGISLTHAGSDGVLNSADDVPIPLGISSYDPFSFSFCFSIVPQLTVGLYQGTAQFPLEDLAGNAYGQIYTWTFRVFPQVDLDNDGVPDADEPGIGLDPVNPDTDGDGVLDGDEDPDNDGLPTNLETLIASDPLQPDSDGDGWQDGQEDYDLDGIVNLSELMGPTDIFVPDTDGDGYFDGMESILGADPTVLSSVPKFSIKASEDVLINPTLVRTRTVIVNQGSPYIANPPIKILDATP